jgi:cyclic pyranopterin phosphate synthase
MNDKCGRTIDYLRISITDRCNLRCIYCMPKEGLPAVHHTEILSYEEILRLTWLFAEAGVKKVKITGGEPLVRKGACGLIRQIKSLSGIEQVTMTTNGALLGDALEELEEAGLDCVNVSLDTLNPEVFKEITGRDEFEDVKKSLGMVIERGRIPLKINCVPMRIAGQEPERLAEIARLHPVHVRYIEMMPIGIGKQFQRVSEDEMLERLIKLHGEVSPSEEKLGNGPCHYYDFKGFCGKIGFISAISHKFCGGCNRVRLTSQGFLKTCLQYDSGADLKALLRGGADDEAILDVIKRVIKEKPEGHKFGQSEISHIEQNDMFQIGG